MLYDEKQLNDFLFAAGLPLQERAKIIREVLDLPKDKRIPAMVKKGKDVPALHRSDVFNHIEDEEVWLELSKLDMRDRVAVLLPYFEETAVFEEESFQLLKERIESKLGYRITSEQLDQMVQMMVSEVRKRSHEPLPAAEEDEAVEPVKSRTQVSKWIWVAAGFFVIVTGILLVQNPGQQEGGSTIVPTESEGSLEEEMSSLNQAVDQEIESLSEELGLSTEAVWQLEFVSNVLSQVNSIEEYIEYAESEEERSSALSEIRRTEQLISSRLMRPISRLDDAASRISASTTYGILEVNDSLLSRFTYDASGMIELYENALSVYDEQLTELDTQLSDFTFSEDVQRLIEKIESNGFEVTILPDQQEFDVNYGEESIDRAMNGFLVNEYLDIIQEQKKQPYIQDDGETAYTYEQQAVKLFQTEELLVRSAGTETLSSELLYHHTELFQYFLRDITDESGQLRSEVKELWEALISEDHQQKYTVARYIKSIYEAFEQNDFYISEEVRKVRDRYTVVPVSYRIRKADAYFPLSESMRAKYNMITAFKEEQDINFLLPKEAALIYVNSLVLNNQEATAQITVPETFGNADKSNWTGTSMQANEITSIQTEYENGKAIVTFSGENFEEHQIIMQEINGVWKAEFDPEHLEWF
ncbi:hypothetical protein [Jeotgalibacillus salarius]|uniref:Uncharacterized protein n=1 Tax=Jeotgalibacillus salarius TaxID=546023 RepID=A0A4Y8LP42_9BACL|nr:hypothetical protein [Jeotgalibacillus salarius]TFE03761.1 hypothetical protein E2626_00070 [Jeotgalibacillus salarius]